jgi:prophage regulatory protein
MEDHYELHRPATILRCAEVERRTGISRSTIYRLMPRGEFPNRVQLSDGAVGWNEAEVEEWVQSRHRVE